MQLIINIDDKAYDEILKRNAQYGVFAFNEIVRNGTPLPKGHGRLIDADKIQFENNEFDTYSDYIKAFNAIYYAPTIIPVDKDI